MWGDVSSSRWVGVVVSTKIVVLAICSGIDTVSVEIEMGLLLSNRLSLTVTPAYL